MCIRDRYMVSSSARLKSTMHTTRRMKRTSVIVSASWKMCIRDSISRLFQMHSNHQNPMESIGTGDIGAGVGFKDIRTGDTLCDENAPVSYTHLTSPIRGSLLYHR